MAGITKRPIWVAIALTFILAFGFLKYGRSIYMPLVYKIKGRDTVDSRIAKIEEETKIRIAGDLGKVGYDKKYPNNIFLVAFKEERVLQVFVKDSLGIRLIKEYPFTGFSGSIGPKLEEGDRQIPEGIYKVEYLNPNSTFYLSLKLDYPNQFDRSKTRFTDLKDMGGDIFIHGKSASIGCIPIGDEAIEEVFLLVHKAIHNEVKVIISPRNFIVNPAYPQIENLDWKEELYDIISEELRAIYQ